MSNLIKTLVSIIFSLSIVLTYTNISYAQHSTNFNNITINDGLSQSTIQAIYQDSKGYIWLGSNDGLNRYNGSKIKIFKSDEENNKISDNYILNIIEDDKKIYGYLQSTE